MRVLQQTFEQPDAAESSFLEKLFSSSFLRGSYKDEKPVIDAKICGSEQEQRRMTSLINTIANNSPTGRQILENAAKAGYSFGFEMQPGSYGFCCEDEKVIRLNPVTRDAKLVATLAHEARHAQQHIRKVPSKFCEFDVATELKLRRATEADAQAAAAQVALEISVATQSKKIWRAFENTDADIARNIENPSSFKSIDDVIANRDKTMQDAFKGWFENWRIVDAYEQGYLYSHMMQVGKCDQKEALALFAEKPFNGHKSSAEILQMVCTTDNKKSYFADNLNIMDEDARMCGLCKETRSAADAFFRERKKMTGQPVDTSYQNLPDRGGLFKSMQMALNGMPMSIKLSAEKKTLASPLSVVDMKRMRQGR